MSENRTEQATPRRRQKANEQGQTFFSRELVGACVFAAALATLINLAGGWKGSFSALFKTVLFNASSDMAGNSAALAATLRTGVAITLPIIAVALLASGGALLLHGHFVFAPASLAPKFERISPAGNAKKLFSSAAVSRLLKTLLPTSLIAYICFTSVVRDWNGWLGAMYLRPQAAPQWFGTSLAGLAWKAAGVMLAWGAFDFWFERQRFEKGLKMSKQEIRDEMRESEPNPAVKQRIRKLQRQMRRSRMLQDVPKATVVVTNPTHYAVALRYDPETMAAPVVLAKGVDLIAFKIREIAQRNMIPTVENVPLAQALYKTAEIGSAIPEQLYTAVAEILAFIFRAQRAMRPQVAGQVR